MSTADLAESVVDEEAPVDVVGHSPASGCDNAEAIDVEVVVQEDVNEEVTTHNANNSRLTPPSERRCIPVVLPRDDVSSPLAMFEFGHHDILGFIVGGEPRLVFEQLKAEVFPHFEEYSSFLVRLRINLSEATDYQLNQLQRHKLYATISSCRLITYSLAHLLVGQMALAGVRPLIGMGDLDTFMDWEKKAQQRVAVKMMCVTYGGNDVTFYPNLWGEACFMCNKCQQLMMPQVMIAHIHEAPEHSQKTTDWGVNQNNWHMYIDLTIDNFDDATAMAYLEKIKSEGPAIYTRDLAYGKKPTPEQIREDIMKQSIVSVRNQMSQSVGVPVDVLARLGLPTPVMISHYVNYTTNFIVQGMEAAAVGVAQAQLFRILFQSFCNQSLSQEQILEVLRHSLIPNSQLCQLLATHSTTAAIHRQLGEMEHQSELSKTVRSIVENANGTNQAHLQHMQLQQVQSQLGEHLSQHMLLGHQLQMQQQCSPTTQAQQNVPQQPVPEVNVELRDRNDGQSLPQHVQPGPASQNFLNELMELNRHVPAQPAQAIRDPSNKLAGSAFIPVQSSRPAQVIQPSTFVESVQQALRDSLQNVPTTTGL